MLAFNFGDAGLD